MSEINRMIFVYLAIGVVVVSVLLYERKNHLWYMIGREKRLEHMPKWFFPIALTVAILLGACVWPVVVLRNKSDD
jgi:hypothetical protein